MLPTLHFQKFLSNSLTLSNRCCDFLVYIRQWHFSQLKNVKTIVFKIFFFFFFFTGETIVVLAKVDNSSSSDMTPKFSLIQKVVYHANGRTKHENTVCHKVADNCIKPKTRKELRCTIKIPSDYMLTIQNCDIISVEYCVKVCSTVS